MMSGLIAPSLSVFLHCEAKAPSSNTAAWLSFASTLIWQVLIIYCLLSYRTALYELFQRLSKLKVAGVEGEFQPQSIDAKPLPSNASVEIKNIGPDGFFTIDGVKQLVIGSGLLESDEHVTETLSLFRTAKQRTWLISTTKSMICILDDAKTRKSGRLIQWRQPITDIKDVRARVGRESGAPVLDIGRAKGWLYSTALHPDPQELEEKIRSLIPAGSS